MMAKSVVCIFNKIKKSILNFYVYVNNIFKLTEKYQPQKLDKAISKHWNHYRLAEEIES